MKYVLFHFAQIENQEKKAQPILTLQCFRWICLASNEIGFFEQKVYLYTQIVISVSISDLWQED